MNTTGNYQLNQWEGSDRIMRTDFNADNAKIDAALKANADNISALSQIMMNKGNCWIYTSSYTGNGSYGQSTPTSMSANFVPRVVLVIGKSTGGTMLGIRGCEMGFVVSYASNWVRFTWSGYQASWYSDSPDTQMNASGEEYLVVMLG